jgi:hypothetical protein
MQEFAEIPGEFLKEGTQFLNRCQKRMFLLIAVTSAYNPSQPPDVSQPTETNIHHSKQEGIH